MGRRRAAREMTEQQLLRWKKDDVLEGLTRAQEQQLLAAVAELLLKTTSLDEAKGEDADE